MGVELEGWGRSLREEGERAGPWGGLSQKRSCDWRRPHAGAGPGLERRRGWGGALGGGAERGRALRAGAGGGDVVGGDGAAWEGSEPAGAEPSGRGRCWVAPGLGRRRRAALTAESARGLPPPRCPAPTPARPAPEP